MSLPDVTLNNRIATGRMDRSPSDPLQLQPFPLTRYIDYRHFRYYYAYGNTPAEDFLESVVDEKDPSVLVLGCGDIRSCFYTLWKKLDASKGRFNGVHFVLNDCCAAVLARNIMFLYLAMEMSTLTKEGGLGLARKKWIAAMWAIWFCHELYPDHERILKDALSALVACSKSVRSWDESTQNPLRGLVKFATPDTLREVCEVWRMWCSGVGSVEQAKAARLTHLQQKLAVGEVKFEYESLAIGWMLTTFGVMAGNDIPEGRNKAMEEEFVAYYKYGSAFAESVLGLPLGKGKTSANPTFFEKSDGTYTLHYGSVPYKSFFQTLLFSKKELTKLKVPHSVVEEMVVQNEVFEQHPLLANSVQQFSIWLSSSAAILTSVRSQRDPKITFAFQCSDAVMFCQQLCSFPESINCEAAFSVIHTSNLLDHIAAPSLVLSTIPLLKPGSYLFTTTMTYKFVAPTTKEYLETVFGFSVELLPVICGVRCIGHEGKYADSISLQPVPWSLSNAIAHTQQLTGKQCTRQLVWQRIKALPLRIAPLDKGSCLAKALCSFMSMPISLYFTSPNTNTNTICTQTAVHILQAFSAQLEASVDTSDYHFWEDLCILLLSHNDVKHIVVHLQTQALLHGFHLHLTVSPSDCPLCTKKPLSDFVSPFSIELPTPSLPCTPTYTVFIHKTRDLQLYPLSPLPKDAHMVDSVAVQEVGDNKLRLDFFFPQHFTADGYCATVVRHVAMATTFAGNIRYPTILLTGILEQFQSSGICYYFERVTPATSFPKFTFGKLIQHCGDSDYFESVVSLSGGVMAALEKQKALQPKQTSSSVLEVFCGRHSISLSYPYDVDYSRTNIKLSRKKRTITVIVPRQAHHFYEEKPMFTVNPDNKLSLPPIPISKQARFAYSGMQYTKQDRIIMESCNRKSSLMPAIVNMKESMNTLFQCSPEEHFFNLSFRQSSGVPDVHGLVAVHNMVFDLQNKTPALDLSFCFLQPSFVDHVAPQWIKIARDDRVRNITVDEAEYKLIQKIFSHFASRTVKTSSISLFVKHKLSRYFTRAVVYPLYSDPDVFVREMEIDEAIHKDDPTHGLSLSSSAQLQQDTPHEATSATDKCTFCESQSQNLKKCAACGKAQYCGKDCQRQHWKEHKLVCQKAASCKSDLTVQKELSQKGTYASDTPIASSALKGDQKELSQKGTYTSDTPIASSALKGDQKELSQKGTYSSDTPIASSALKSDLTVQKEPSQKGTYTSDTPIASSALKSDLTVQKEPSQKGTYTSDTPIASSALKSDLTVQKEPSQKGTYTSDTPIASSALKGDQKEPTYTGDTPIASSAVTSSDAENRCNFCGSPSQNLKKCAACGKVQYCGRECQKKHWKEHKLVCQKATSATTISKGDPQTTQETPDSKGTIHTDPSDLNKCAACGRESDSLKKCSCHCVAYCNVDCQKKHWPKHKHLHRQQEAN